MIEQDQGWLPSAPLDMVNANVSIENDRARLPSAPLDKENGNSSIV